MLGTYMQIERLCSDELNVLTNLRLNLSVSLSFLTNAVEIAEISATSVGSGLES